MDIKVIETEYKGYKFRSRLEARWAVFFDSLGIKYEYEPEGVELEDGTKYLPDFYLTEMDAYVEIKGIGAIDIKIMDDGVEICDGREKALKYIKAASEISKKHTYMILCGDPYDVFLWDHGGGGTGNVFFTGECVGKLYAADDPNFTAECAETKCAECTQSNSLCYYPHFLGFTNKAIILQETDATYHYFPAKPDGFELFVIGDENWASMDIDELSEAIIKNVSAARIARQVRFEHGEKPKV